ncbi:MAG: hypothetical protein CMJ40_09735 [Phycisphaerae bacterium]|nr:hypothetical protein [Phycisphaerae bacterium]|tara:strand:- start:1295 stop:1699 length:405 start_codon:yes stop_codon:yes gene_type:complete
MRTGAQIAAIVLMAMSFLSGCASSGGGPDQADAQQLTVKLGGTQRFFLVSNRTTGFQWVINTESSTGMDHVTVAKTGYTDTDSPDGLVGAPGRQWWVIRGASPGKAELQLDYKRPWEADMPPARRARVLVEVVN